MYKFTALKILEIMAIRTIIKFLFLTTLFSGCGLVGIYFSIHNPKSEGKYKTSKDDILLGNLTELKTCYDVLHYDIAVQLFPHNKTIKGKVIMKAIAVNDFNKLQIDLHPNLKIESFTINGENVVYKRNHSAIEVELKNTIQKNQNFTSIISYSGKPVEANRPPWDGGTVWKKDANKKPYLGVACEGLNNGSSLWWPGKDHSSDEPDSFAIAITGPRGLVGVSNGVLEKVDSVSIPDSTTWFWKNHYKINSYNITYYLGDFKLLKDSMKSAEGMLPMNHYVLSYNYEKAKIHFQQVKKIILFYEKKFGPYPWFKDGFKLVESPFAGMEHQSAIAYGNGYKNQDHSTDYIILHETAHEWWGNSVSAADLAHGWIHEGFATYCEALFYEEIAGKSAYESKLAYDRWFIKNSRPVVKPMNMRWFYYKDSDMYMKGTWILATMRTLINNDALFFDILKTFYMENQRKEILTDVLQKLVEQKTGADWDWFFNQYLYSRKTPILEWCIDDSANLYYRWIDANDDFVMPIKYSPSFIASDANRNWVKLSPSKEIKKTKMLINASFVSFDNNEKLYGAYKNNKLIKLFEKQK